MSLAFTNLSLVISILFLVAVCGLFFWVRARRWNERQQAWRESERDTLMEFEASSRGRLGRRAADLPSIKTPIQR